MALEVKVELDRMPDTFIHDKPCERVAGLEVFVAIVDGVETISNITLR